MTASLLLVAMGLLASGPAGWPSDLRYRVGLEVDTRGVSRSSSPATVELDLAQELAAQGGSGTPDLDTIEIVAFDAEGRPFVHDAQRAGAERFLIPFWLEPLYPTSVVTLHFVVPDERHTRFLVLFDTTDSGRARPERYLGLVGDGDLFVEGYGRREVGPSGYDAMGDLDGDGDLDLLRGGTQPFMRCLDNVGSGRFVDRGWLTSGGKRMLLPHDEGHRSWASLTLADPDGDGDLDLLVHIRAAKQRPHVVAYENTTPPGGLPTFTRLGLLRTLKGTVLRRPVDLADWDGDGRLDVLAFVDGVLAWYRNRGGKTTPLGLGLEEARTILANGRPLALDRPRVAAVDLDADGDLDLLVASDDGRVYYFENAGTRAEPLLRMGRAIFHFEWMDCRTGLAVSDFDGDGRLDVLTGRYWERTRHGEQPRVHGRLFRNVGTATRPRFEARDATNGAPYTEQLQPLDGLRQNAARVADWDEDGRPDLIVGDSDGFVSFFRNRTGRRAPLFEPGRRLMAEGRWIRVWGEEREQRAAGYARPEIVDWNNDGLQDLLVADGRAWLTLFLNEGQRGAPRLGPGRRLRAAGQPIDGTGRGSAIVRDWDGDGRKDVLFAMSGESEEAIEGWQPVESEVTAARGLLFYPNEGTDGDPVLGPPHWVRAGPDERPIDLERPNLGDFVDWDGDGRLDLIACEFENDVRLFRNTAAPGRGQPSLAGDWRGELLLESWTREMISGAQAIDWNADGDLDIITGQGHGGSGVRFFERDAIEDQRRETAPQVTIRRSGTP